MISENFYTDMEYSVGENCYKVIAVENEMKSVESEEVCTTVSKIDEVFENSISIFPNPATLDLKIESGELKIKSVAVTDVLGKNILLISNQNTINVSNLVKGIYCVKIETEKGTLVKMFIKQ